MKRYLISFPASAGDAELWYNEAGKLVRIDISKTNMRPDVLEEFKLAAPVHVDQLHTAWGEVKVTITEADIIISFEQWWNKWGSQGNKVNRKRCVPVYEKFSASKKLKSFMGMDKYFAFCIKNNRKILDPENYLKNETWDNEYK
jgi:hypothetical protein